MNCGDTTMGQIWPHTQTPKHTRPDHPVVTDSTTTHQTLQTIETGLHALDAENKVTLGWTARKEFFARTAGLQIMTKKYAVNTTTMLQAQQTATSQQDIIPQQHHHQ